MMTKLDRGFSRGHHATLPLSVGAFARIRCTDKTASTCCNEPCAIVPSRTSSWWAASRCLPRAAEQPSGVTGAEPPVGEHAAPWAEEPADKLHPQVFLLAINSCFATSR